MSTISFSNCLAIINAKDVKGNPIPFSLKVYSLNRNSKKGGVLKVYENAKLLNSKKFERNLENLTKQATAEVKDTKNPNHFKNRTRNIELANGDIKKIHVRLIDSINGQKVLP